MRRVVLPGTTLETSALGFGSVGGGMDEKARLALYQHAFDLGITHFDTARSYGLGHAERTLGKFLKGKRDQVTVTTKLGLLPPRTSALLSVARHVARRVEKILPALGAAAKQRATGMMTSAGRFAVEDARRSVETSLRELNTDYVDILLLHECSPADVQPELVEYLARCAADGKTRYTGIATSTQATADILKSSEAFPGVVQMAGGLLTASESISGLEGRARVSHSVFDGLQRIRAAMSANPALARKLSDATGMDLSLPAPLPALFISYALHANPTGIVLFSSSKFRNIDANLAAASAMTPASEQIERLSTALRSEFGLEGAIE